jgi:hypothetical protein
MSKSCEQCRERDAFVKIGDRSKPDDFVLSLCFECTTMFVQARFQRRLANLLKELTAAETGNYNPGELSQLFRRARLEIERLTKCAPL